MVGLAGASSLGAIADVLEGANVLGGGVWNSGRNHGEKRMMQPAHVDFQRRVVELFSLLTSREVPYVLVGGVALLKYVEGRNTKDIDLLLPPKWLEKLPEILVAERDRDFVRGVFGGVPVDLLLTSDPVFRLVHERHATTHGFHEMEVRCATVEGLILLKLYALPSLFRLADGQRIALYEADLTMLIERYRPNLEPILTALEPYLDIGQLHELRNIIADIQRRIDRIQPK
jgi:hypothetical protein